MMDKILWVVHDNLGNEHEFSQLKSAFNKYEIPFHAFHHVPFSDELPQVIWDGPVIAYGATRFIENVFKEGAWSPGAFFDDKAFSMSSYNKHYGEHSLNYKSECSTIEIFSKREHDSDQLFFVRPQGDHKEFAGDVVEFGKISKWFRKVSIGNYILRGDTPIIVSKPKNLGREWRLFIVEGRVSTGSQYRHNHRLSQDPHIPKTVIEFAELMTRKWSPADVFAMDVCEHDGGLKIIELNCFNSSGFYLSNIEKLVFDVSQFIAKRYTTTLDNTGA
ncbi:MAG: hypothetical protein COB90_02185 [Hyphomicrobiales bacterium]|nr:MAG: hypothetical protein COB90_02185 [Hyphomicrobiales bacterium]